MRKDVCSLAAFLLIPAFSCDTASVSGIEQETAESDWLRLSQPNSWQKNRGEWTLAGTVSMDPKDNSKLAFEPGEEIWVNGPAGKTVDLHSSKKHRDAEVHIEFMVPKGSNSGVYLQSRYEVQIFDSWGVEEPKYSDCGGIYQRWKDNNGFEGHPPGVNASRPPGEWQTLRVVFRAPRFDSAGIKSENARFVEVVHNGIVIHKDVEVTGPTRAASFDDEVGTGPLMIQGDHGPIAIREVRIKRLALE